MIPFNLNFHYAYGEPEDSADFRCEFEDFCVNEMMTVALTGEGEHFWLNIIKSNENTQWIADKLADYFDVKTMDVGYAGKKDRRALTQQWFSVYLPGKPHQIDWQDFQQGTQVNATLVRQVSHKQKLKPGMHDGNHFDIVLRNVVETDTLNTRLQTIQARGVPNYFGNQRFGRDANNLMKMHEWIEKGGSIRNRNLRGLLISSARSYLFNRVLSERVRQQSWLNALPGDPDTTEATAPLWGRGRNRSQAQTNEFESEVLRADAVLGPICDKLERVGLKQERRALRLMPHALTWQYDQNTLKISFNLAKGEYATSVLREVCKLNEKTSVNFSGD